MKFIFPLFLLAGITASKAQPFKDTPPWMLIAEGDLRMECYQYAAADSLYQAAYDELRSPELAMKIGQIQMILRDYKRAESWYGRIISRDKAYAFPEARYYHGIALKRLGKNKEAANILTTYIDSALVRAVKNDSLIQSAGRELKGLELMFTEGGFADNKDILVTHLGNTVNSMSTDQSPSVDPEGNLFYTSLAKKKVIRLDKENDYHAKIYQTNLDKNNKWVKPKTLPENINGEGIHNGNVYISQDGNRMYLTKVTLTGSELETSTIFYSSQKGRTWSPPQEVKGVNGKYLAKNPAEGEVLGNQVLFFAANIPGGKGGFDLYYAPKIRDGEFGTPVNLGEDINTNGNEETPFFRDGSLYFSTDGRPGLGGYDIFKTTWDGSRWSKPVNLGYRYNSGVDDSGFTLEPNGESGYLVSNRITPNARSLRSATCCDHIYSFGKKVIQVDLLATVLEGRSPLNGANIKLVEMLADDFGPQADQAQPNTHEFTFPLEIDKAYTAIVSKAGYYPDTFAFNTVGIVDNYTIKKTVTLRPKPVEPETETITVSEPIRLNNILYDYDDDRILPAAEPDLSALLDLLNRYANMKIELSSHTDAQGSDAYNEDLSQRRAESARQWLLNKGIAAERIKAVGYGERLILNHCVNGVKCTDDEHRFNRRTEFKILEGPTTIEIKKEVLKGQKVQKPSRGLGSSGLRSVRKFPDRAKITFEETFHDFGLIDEGAEISHTFYFTNAGKADLKIMRVSAGGHTKIKWPSDPIKPGDKNSIEAVFDTDNKTGEHEITIQIIANSDPVVVEARFRVFIKEKK